jgi:hypothetical protein
MYLLSRLRWPMLNYVPCRPRWPMYSLSRPKLTSTWPISLPSKPRSPRIPT